MKKAELFKHNEIAYNKLCNALKVNKCATINHATGTGKSFIALKYLYNNRNKKYLYIAPTYPIINQLLNDCHKIGLNKKDINIDTMIYRTLLDLDMDELYKKYDGIIFDEYHRCGAKETYKKIKQLKLNLEEDKNNDKKFIGLTATPIRYLDKERNMTEEIFDGVVASSISLAEAMLEGLLPIPEYINSKIACRPQLEMLKKKFHRIPLVKERKSIDNKIKHLMKQIDNGITDNKTLVNKYIRKKEGKYIVFCDTIKNLDNYYSEIDDWFSSFDKVKKYRVHSERDKEINQAELDEFNKEKDGLSVLLCVDILNEGVHVDDIDGVFLLRKTQSPIIYFQQIGRALSFSGRNKSIKIFDLVNNFGNHNAIDMVFQEIKLEVERLSKIYPERQEQYKNVLGKFKIMDETREILQEISNIKEQISPQFIISCKISDAINKVEKQIQENNKDTMSIFFSKEAKEAYITLSKYSKYVSNEQFRRLKKLDIFLPEDLSYTWEEREKQLKGYDSFYEKEINQNSEFVKDFIEFINVNGYKPDISSRNNNEKEIANNFFYVINNLSDEQKEALKECFKTKHIKLLSYEKVAVGEKINYHDITEIIKYAEEYKSRDAMLPSHILGAIEKITLKYTLKENQQLFEFIEYNDEKILEEKAKKEEVRCLLLSEIVDVFEENIELSEDELMKTGIYEKIQKLSPKDIYFIKNKYGSMKKEYLSGLIYRKTPSNMKKFIAQSKKADTNILNDYINDVLEDKQMSENMYKVIKFMIENNGKLPKEDTDDDKEKRLAILLAEYSKNGLIDKKLFDIDNEDRNILYNPTKTLYEVTKKEFENEETKLCILKCLIFLKENGYNPLPNSRDEKERDLAKQYQELVIKKLSSENIDQLNVIFNSYKYLDKKIQKYISNINGRE